MSAFSFSCSPDSRRYQKWETFGFLLDCLQPWWQVKNGFCGKRTDKIIKDHTESWEWRDRVRWVGSVRMVSILPGLSSLCLSQAYYTVRMHKWVIHPPTSPAKAKARGVSWAQLWKHCMQTGLNTASFGEMQWDLSLPASNCPLGSRQVPSIQHRKMWFSFCTTSFQSCHEHLALSVLRKGWIKAASGHGEGVLHQTDCSHRTVELLRPEETFELIRSKHPP